MQKLLLVCCHSENRAASQIWKALPNMVFPPIWGEKWRRSEHAHASYPGLFFPSPGFSSYMGREERRVQGLDYDNHCMGNVESILGLVLGIHQRTLGVLCNSMVFSMENTIEKTSLITLNSQVSNSLCYTSQLKYVFRLEENVSRAIGQNYLTH